MPTLVDPETLRRDSIVRWHAKALRVIADRLADARGHAWNALTERVAKAGDGRSTWRAARTSRGYQAATARMDELARALRGKTPLSLDGLIRDARAAFYREAFPLLEPTIPAEVRKPKWGPTKAGEDAARGMVIHGVDLASEVDATIAAAKAQLKAAINLAGRRDELDRAAAGRLDRWEEASLRAIRAKAMATLSDSEAAAFNLAAADMIDPKFWPE